MAVAILQTTYFVFYHICSLCIYLLCRNMSLLHLVCHCNFLAIVGNNGMVVLLSKSNRTIYFWAPADRLFGPLPFGPFCTFKERKFPILPYFTLFYLFYKTFIGKKCYFWLWGLLHLDKDGLFPEIRIFHK